MQRVPFLILLGFLCSFPALAASNAAKNRCADAVRILRGGPTHIYQTADIDATQVQKAQAHWNQIAANWNLANNQMKQVPPGDLVKGDPELKECFTALADYQDYVKLLKGKLDAAQGQATTLGPFLAEVKPFEKSFLHLAAVAIVPEADILVNLKAADARKILSDLATVAQTCAAKMPEAGQNPPAPVPQKQGQSQTYGHVHLPDDFTHKADHWCWVAKNREALMQTASANKGVDVEGYGNYTMAFEDLGKQYGPEHPTMDAWLAVLLVNPADFLTKLDVARDRWFTEIGLTAPKERKSDSLKARIAELQKLVDQVAPQVPKPTPGPHDAKIEAGAGKTLKGIFPGAKVNLAVMDSPDWTVRKNSLGIPLERYRSGQMVFSVPGSKWCQQRAFSYAETWVGNGFAPSSTVDVLPMTRFLACK